MPIVLAPTGLSLRMFDAAAGWVVKRVRYRHMQAPASPSQLAAVAGVFAALRHRSVVVPELLNALDAQVGKGVGGALQRLGVCGVPLGCLLQRQECQCQHCIRAGAALVRHRSVVVPELLNALDAQVGKGVGGGIFVCVGCLLQHQECQCSSSSSSANTAFVLPVQHYR